MNDRFNFRCFDTDIQKFIVGFRLCDHYKWPNGIIEQCTGLKDKNGRLIYEGDIVLTEEDGYGHIRWDNELAQFFVATEEYYTFDNIFPSEMEVVGNIHENPELLEAKK